MKNEKRAELAKIVMRWLKTAKPDNAEAPSDLIDDIMAWHNAQPCKCKGE